VVQSGFRVLAISSDAFPAQPLYKGGKWLFLGMFRVAEAGYRPTAI
jgi:hypothetical protein